MTTSVMASASNFWRPSTASSSTLAFGRTPAHSWRDSLPIWSYGDCPYPGFPTTLPTDLAQFLALYGSEDVAPPATEWGAAEIATDALHHIVYAATTGRAYGWIDQRP